MLKVELNFFFLPATDSPSVRIDILIFCSVYIVRIILLIFLILLWLFHWSLTLHFPVQLYVQALSNNCQVFLPLFTLTVLHNKVLLGPGNPRLESFWRLQERKVHFRWKHSTNSNSREGKLHLGLIRRGHSNQTLSVFVNRPITQLERS